MCISTAFLVCFHLLTELAQAGWRASGNLGVVFLQFLATFKKAAAAAKEPRPEPGNTRTFTASAATATNQPQILQTSTGECTDKICLMPGVAAAGPATAGLASGFDPLTQGISFRDSQKGPLFIDVRPKPVRPG